MKNLRMREATVKDLEIAKAFQKRSMDETRWLKDPMLSAKEDAKFYPELELKRILTSKDAVYVIADVDGRPVGCGFAEIEEVYGEWCRYEKRGYLGQLYVEPGFRRQGLAEKIMKYRIRWLRKKGIKFIVLRSYANNKKAIAFFRKQGFIDYAIEMRYSK